MQFQQNLQDWHFFYLKTKNEKGWDFLNIIVHPLVPENLSWYLCRKISSTWLKINRAIKSKNRTIQATKKPEELSVQISNVTGSQGRPAPQTQTQATPAGETTAETEGTQNLIGSEQILIGADQNKIWMVHTTD